MSILGSAPLKEKDEAGGSNLNHLAILERYGGKRGAQALALIAAGQMAWPLVKAGFERVNRSEDFTITIPGVDPIYPDLHEWVLERIPEGERKAMIANTSLSDYESDDDRVRLRYDGSRKQLVTIDGHKVIVAVDREPVSERVNLPENWRQYMEKIVFTAKAPEGRDAVVEMVSKLLDRKRSQPAPPALYMPARWGGGEWSRRGDLPPRSLESTVLKDGQLEGLVDDLGAFLQAEEEYNRLSQPWHRGYIFHGAPGTGKTSVARALANHFDLATYYLPLGDIDKDDNLLLYVAAIKPRSVLLLEDIDVFSAATERTEDTGKASIAAMLNALDGVWTPHGLITIMTTNNREALDEAIVRPGRVDVDEEFTALDRSQARRLASFFGFSDGAVDLSAFVGRSPADLTEHLKTRRLEGEGTLECART